MLVFYVFSGRIKTKRSVGYELCPLVLGELRVWSVKESGSLLPWDSPEKLESDISRDETLLSGIS